MELLYYPNCTASHNKRDYLYRIEWMIIFFGGYIFVGLGSLIGNSMVASVVVFKRELRTVTDVFIGALAIADLLITAIPLWMTPYYHYNQMWGLGVVPCYLFYGLGGAGMVWSAYILAAMAIDRYMLVVFPMHSKITKKACMIIIAFILLVTGVLLTPLLLRLKFYTITPCYNIYCVKACSFCQELWYKGSFNGESDHIPDNASRFAYSIIFLLLRTVIPFSVIGYCHWQIGSKLNSQHKRLMDSRSTERRLQDVKRNQRLQKLLISMVFIFIVFTFPLDVFNVVQDSQISFKYTIDVEYHPIIFLSCHLLAMTGTLLNPIVYAYWNENFKREIRLAVQCSSKGFIIASQYISGIIRKDTMTHGPGLQLRSLSSGGAKETDNLLKYRNLEECDSILNKTNSTKSTPIISRQPSVTVDTNKIQSS